MRKENGFTLIEVMMALAVMATVLLAMATSTASFLQIVTVADRNIAAQQLVDSRIDLIQMDPNYNDLASNYVGTESNFPTLEGYTRTTTIRQVPAGTPNYQVITVTVQGPGLAQPVSRTITVAAP